VQLLAQARVEVRIERAAGHGGFTSGASVDGPACGTG
jgi:hypothetical protein